MLFVVIIVVDLNTVVVHYTALSFILIKIFNMAIQILEQVMIYQAIILLIRLLIYLEQQHHNYRNVKCTRSYLDDII